MTERPRSSRASRSFAAARGTVLTEYVVVLTLVSVGCVSALMALGPLLARLFLVQKAVLLLPMPV